MTQCTQTAHRARIYMTLAAGHSEQRTMPLRSLAQLDVGDGFAEDIVGNERLSGDQGEAFGGEGGEQSSSSSPAAVLSGGRQPCTSHIVCT